MTQTAETGRVITAARRVLREWDADDELEKNDLSEHLWEAMAALRAALTQGEA